MYCNKIIVFYIKYKLVFYICIFLNVCMFRKIREKNYYNRGYYK